jgi:hypothetical protein
MTFNEMFPAWMKQWAQPLHWVSVFSIVAGLIIHIYMGAVFPEEKEAFFSMFSGKVSAWYARAHHEKWYWQKVREELEWEDQVIRESKNAEEQGGAAAALESTNYGSGNYEEPGAGEAQRTAAEPAATD